MRESPEKNPVFRTYSRKLRCGPRQPIDGFPEEFRERNPASLNAKDPSVCVNLGEVFLRIGENGEAARYLREAASLDPEHLSPYANRARGMLSAIESRSSTQLHPLLSSRGSLWGVDAHTNRDRKGADFQRSSHGPAGHQRR